MNDSKLELTEGDRFRLTNGLFAIRNAKSSEVATTVDHSMAGGWINPWAYGNVSYDHDNQIWYLVPEGNDNSLFYIRSKRSGFYFALNDNEKPPRLGCRATPFPWRLAYTYDFKGIRIYDSRPGSTLYLCQYGESIRSRVLEGFDDHLWGLWVFDYPEDDPFQGVGKDKEPEEPISDVGSISASLETVRGFASTVFSAVDLTAGYLNDVAKNTSAGLNALGKVVFPLALLATVLDLTQMIVNIAQAKTESQQEDPWDKLYGKLIKEIDSMLDEKLLRERISNARGKYVSARLQQTMVAQLLERINQEKKINKEGINGNGKLFGLALTDAYGSELDSVKEVLDISYARFIDAIGELTSIGEEGLPYLAPILTDYFSLLSLKVVLEPQKYRLLYWTAIETNTKRMEGLVTTLRTKRIGLLDFNSHTDSYYKYNNKWERTNTNEEGFYQKHVDEVLNRTFYDEDNFIKNVKNTIAKRK